MLSAIHFNVMDDDIMRALISTSLLKKNVEDDDGDIEWRAF